MFDVTTDSSCCAQSDTWQPDDRKRSTHDSASAAAAAAEGNEAISCDMSASMSAALRRRKVSTVTGGLVNDINDFNEEIMSADDESQSSFFAKVSYSL